MNANSYFLITFFCSLRVKLEQQGTKKAIKPFFLFAQYTYWI